VKPFSSRSFTLLILKSRPEPTSRRSPSNPIAPRVQARRKSEVGDTFRECGGHERARTIPDGRLGPAKHFRKLGRATSKYIAKLKGDSGASREAVLGTALLVNLAVGTLRGGCGFLPARHCRSGSRPMELLGGGHPSDALASACLACRPGQFRVGRCIGRPRENCLRYHTHAAPPKRARRIRIRAAFSL
jgi:hypothetical protein